MLPNSTQQLDALDVGVVIQAADRRILYVNPRATALLGLSVEEIQARTTDDARWDIVFSDGTPVPDDAHPGPRALASGEAVRNVLLGLKRPDSGERVWLLASATPLRDARGEVVQVVISFTDVSDVYRSFREHETTYQAVFGAMSEGVVVHAVDGAIQSANEAAQRALGLTLDQMTGRAATDPRWRLLNQDGTPLEPDAIPSEVVLRTGQPVGGRLLGVHRPSGALAWLLVGANPLREPGDERLRGVVATFADITEQRSTAVALESSRAQLLQVLDAVPGVVYQFLRHPDGSDSYPFVGGRTRELFGLSADELRRAPQQMFAQLGAEVRAELDARINAAVATGTAFEHELPISLPGRGLRWLKVQGQPAISSEGLLYTGVILDVTESHRLADALRRSQRRDAMGEMAAGIAHNFNNMLAVIIPNIEMAAADVGEETATYLREAERAAANAADLVRRMLNIVRAEPGDADSAADLVAAVREALHICRQTFDRSLRIEQVIDVDRAVVRCTPAELQQLVLNLCLNARDAMLDRPDPTLRVRIADAGSNRVRLEVQDCGRGMSPDVLRRLGEPFFTTKDPGKGTGLGVATVVATVVESGASWQVESEEDRGTTFRIDWPTVEAPSRERRSRPSPAATTLQGIALIVDDEPMVRAALARLVQRAGYHVETAASAEEGLALAERIRDAGLKVILLDLSMPGIPGAQALPMFRATAPRAPVIVLSGYVPDPAVLSGAAMALQKPVGYRALVDAIRQATGQLQA